MRNMEILFKDAAVFAKQKASHYSRFQKRWVRFMKAVKKDKDLFKHFNRF